jgi:hypothetical protein
VRVLRRIRNRLEPDNLVAWDGIEPPTRGFSVPRGPKIEEDEKG